MTSPFETVTAILESLKAVGPHVEARVDAAWGAAFAHRLAVLGHGLTVAETREDGTRVESVVDARVEAARYADEVAAMAREAHS